jgi:5'-nucleotidase
VKPLQFLVVNDDGIDAPGIAALASAMARIGAVTVVAPSEERSECGHSVTTRRTLSVNTRNARCVTTPQTGWFAVDGTPVDCVRIGLQHLCPTADWVLSGINAGGNLGGDVWVSGTVAAAREAALRGRSSIALSQYRRGDVSLCWQRTGDWAYTIVQQLIQQPPRPNEFWNVNFPAIETPSVQGARECFVDPHPLPADYVQEEDGTYRYTAKYQDRPRREGSDVDQCFRGSVTWSRIILDHHLRQPTMHHFGT